MYIHIIEKEWRKGGKNDIFRENRNTGAQLKYNMSILIKHALSVIPLLYYYFYYIIIL